MRKRIINNLFIRGPITTGFIEERIREYGLNTSIGAHSLFLGQVRSDDTGGSKVSAIEYTAQKEMAIEKFHEMQAALFEKYSLAGLHVYHSTGIVKAGDICLFVLALAEHRAEAIAACSEAVELVKSELPVWGKLFLDNATVQWKENS